jgi:hypothetical protein
MIPADARVLEALAACDGAVLCWQVPGDPHRRRRERDRLRHAGVEAVIYWMTIGRHGSPRLVCEADGTDDSIQLLQQEVGRKFGREVKTAVICAHNAADNWREGASVRIDATTYYAQKLG